MILGLRAVGLAVVAAVTISSSVVAHAPSGAIFTTTATGDEVNLNIFPSREAVYLDGGPGPGAPQTAAGLDDGTYVFQVTNPNGKVLLSTDRARCRQFTAAGGVIAAVVDTDCEHITGNDVDHPPAKTVQLFPFNLTPNPGGVFKVWVTRVEDFLLGCQAFGQAGTSGLDVVDCGDAPANHHGFIPSHSKTDNFKVKDKGKVREIDIRFFRDLDNDGHIDSAEVTSGAELLTGLRAYWTDTAGVTNLRHSDPNYSRFAHVEALEPGVHTITIPAVQPGCEATLVHQDNIDQTPALDGAWVVKVEFFQNDPDGITHYIDVACKPLS
jgi:hypothetical protein